MLIYSTVPGSPKEIAAQAAAVIDGGCRWIQISSDGNDADMMKQCAEEIIPLCKENDIFLVLDSNVDLVDNLRVHGVHLLPGDMAAPEAREKLGPHAIVGQAVKTAADIIALKGKDIDYVTLSGYPTSLSLDDIKSIIAEVAESGMKIPVVVSGNITTDEIAPLLEAGVNGIMLSKEIAGSFNPAEETRRYLDALPH